MIDKTEHAMSETVEAEVIAGEESLLHLLAEALRELDTPPAE